MGIKRRNLPKNPKKSSGFTQPLASLKAGFTPPVTKLVAGFTIIELLIATAVFALVLIVALTGFFQVSQTFFKGQSSTRTQANAKAITDSLAGDLKFASTVTSPKAAGSANFLCIGNARYTFNIYKKVDFNNHDNNLNFGLLRDVLPGCNSTSNPFGTAPFDQNNPPKELLGNKMRLNIFCICNKSCGIAGACFDGTDLWNTVVKIAYGDDESLEDENTTDPKCNSNLNISRFCAIGEIHTTVSKAN